MLASTPTGAPRVHARGAAVAARLRHLRHVPVRGRLAPGRQLHEPPVAARPHATVGAGRPPQPALGSAPQHHRPAGAAAKTSTAWWSCCLRPGWRLIPYLSFFFGLLASLSPGCTTTIVHKQDGRNAAQTTHRPRPCPRVPPVAPVNHQTRSYSYEKLQLREATATPNEKLRETKRTIHKRRNNDNRLSGELRGQARHSIQHPAKRI